MTPSREAVVALPTLEDLASYVHRELCKLDALDPAHTPLHRGNVKRAGKPAAVLFHIEGPRLLRTSAVWSIDENRILFYNSTGARARAVRLSESPDAPTAKAA